MEASTQKSNKKTRTLTSTGLFKQLELLSEYTNDFPLTTNSLDDDDE